MRLSTTRSALGLVVAILLLCSLVLQAQSNSSRAQEIEVPASPALGGDPERPNVLVIMTDDQRDQGTMSVLPAVRRLFGEGGVNYRNAYATTPLCCPSRASIFTGQYAHNHGVRANAQGKRLPHNRTIQRYLHDEGYRTGLFGRFVNAWDLSDDPPHFDDWTLYERGRPYYNLTYNVDGDIRRVPGYSTTFLGDQAKAFIEQQEGNDLQPWLMFVTPFAPHTPAVAERRYRGDRVPSFEKDPAIREKNVKDKPRFVRKEWAKDRSFGRGRNGQLRTLMSVNDMVKRIFRTLDRTGENASTLAFFLSDNGYLWGEHGLIGKGTPYTRSLTIPLLARWPGHLQAGQTQGRPVANIDLAPTIIDALDLTPSVPMDGRSLLEDWGRTRLHHEFWTSKAVRAKWASTRTKRYQYVEYYDGHTDEIVFREYYDLRNDPWQLHNLYKDGKRGNDPATRRLHAQLQQDSECVASSCP